MSDPPPPPQVSADGKFYWDGTRWLPMTQAVAPAPQTVIAAQVPTKGHALRNVSIGCLGPIALLIIIGVIANGSNGTKRPVPQIDLSGRMSHQARVGGEDAISLTVTNKGPGDFETLVIYLNSSDNWWKNHVITDPSGCTIHASLERLDCGPFKLGETR